MAPDEPRLAFSYAKIVVLHRSYIRAMKQGTTIYGQSLRNSNAVVRCYERLVREIADKIIHANSLARLA